MAKRIVIIGVIAMLFVSPGCQKANEEADKNAILTLIAKDTVWFNSNTEVDSTDSGTYLTMLDDTTKIIWWRGKQTHPDTNVTISIVNDSAFVEWERTNAGTLYVIAWTPSDNSWHTWRKTLYETVHLNSIFRRTGDINDENRGWELKKISCAWGASSNNKVSLDSIKIESESNGTFVIVDPANIFYSIDSLITFKPKEEVHITLYTRGEDARAFLHTFVLLWPFYLRLPFNKTAEGIYEGTWKTQVIPFPRFAIFDVLNYNTLFTEEGEYDFNGLLFPYNIKN